MVFWENVGRDDGRGRKSLGFAVCETRGHAAPFDVPPDAVFRIEGDDELGVEATDVEADCVGADGAEADDESDCRVPHPRHSSAIAPPSHAGVKTR